ncbi:MAG: hypothetical protein H6713_31085 [Myxococcales bacterium]|nr:hypothetical protein [Myxococcales bacterium]MCB9754408.1 hypothetical protein [Myxococcales bacterium]
MSPRDTLALVAAALVSASCSVAAPTPAPVSCETNEDCDAGEVCSADQGGVCVKAELPPRKIVGIHIEEESKVFGDATFFLDLLAEDRAVRQVTSFPNRYRISKFNARDENGDLVRPGVRDTLNLGVSERGYFAALDAAEKMEPYETPLMDALITLSQGSRLGLSSNSRPKGGISYPPRDSETLELLAETITLAWPHHDDEDALSQLPLVATLSPTKPEEGMVSKRGVIYRLLRRSPPGDGADTYNIQLDTTLECHRRLDGALIMLPGPNSPEPGTVATSVRMRYSTPHATLSSVASPGGPELVQCFQDLCPAPAACIMDDELELMRCGCESDDHCNPGLACDVERGYCALDLTGRTAQNNIEALIDGDPFRSYLYTYCDDAVEEDRSLDLIITVTPSAESGLPELSFRASPEFEAATESSQTIAQLPGNLCLPNWPVAQPVEIPLGGAPVAIGERGVPIAQEYVCCDLSCLENDTPPSTPAECEPEAVVSFSGVFVRPGSEPGDDVDVWADNECLPLYSSAAPEQGDPNEVAFSRAASIECSSDGCTANLSRGPTDAPIAYSMRVEPKSNSVFRSRALDDVVLEEGLSSLEPLTLEYRVQLRGRVTPSDALCEAQVEDPMDGSSSCVIEREAQVVAERLRIAGDDDPVLAPYYYARDTFDRGKFVLAVNPGVYLVTAYPAIGSQGTASRIKVVDLRLDSTRVKYRDDGVPEATLADPIELDIGQLATIELDEFHKSTAANPVDLGSWTLGDPLEFEGVPLDLNDPNTCYKSGEGEAVGCVVRQLTNNNAKVLISQQRYVTFSTRSTAP